MRNSFGRDICIQGRGVSSKQYVKVHFKIPEFILYFGEALTEKNLLERKGEKRGKRKQKEKGKRSGGEEKRKKKQLIEVGRI